MHLIRYFILFVLTFSFVSFSNGVLRMPSNTSSISRGEIGEIRLNTASSFNDNPSASTAISLFSENIFHSSFHFEYLLPILNGNELYFANSSNTINIQFSDIVLGFGYSREKVRYSYFDDKEIFNTVNFSFGLKKTIFIGFNYRFGKSSFPSSNTESLNLRSFDIGCYQHNAIGDKIQFEINTALVIKDLYSSQYDPNKKYLFGSINPGVSIISHIFPFLDLDMNYTHSFDTDTFIKKSESKSEFVYDGTKKGFSFGGGIIALSLLEISRGILWENDAERWEHHYGYGIILDFQELKHVITTLKKNGVKIVRKSEQDYKFNIQTNFHYSNMYGAKERSIRQGQNSYSWELGINIKF